jgi:hypothetical protein
VTSVVLPFPPSGKVTFYDRDTVLATGTLDATGTASISTVALLPGGHRLRARFQESGWYSFSESPSLVQYVTSLPSSTFTLGESGLFGGIAANNTMTMAEFNGDGKMDFAVGQSGGIAIYLGNGEGTFQAPVSVFGLLGIGSLLETCAALGCRISWLSRVPSSLGVLLRLLSTGIGTMGTVRSFRGQASRYYPAYSSALRTLARLFRLPT